MWVPGQTVLDRYQLVERLGEGLGGETWEAEGPRSPVQTARCGLQIVEALGVLDRLGVLHRDLKPANVFVGTTHTGELQLRVGDFGISRPLRDGMARTQDRSLTPSYAAPEQLTGLPLTRATDLFALGGVLSFLATGRDPEGAAATGHDALDLLVGTLRHPDPARRPDLEATRRSLEAIAAGTDAAPNPPVETATTTVTWEPTGDFGRTLLPPTTGGGGSTADPSWNPIPERSPVSRPPQPRRALGWGVFAGVVALGLVAAWVLVPSSDPPVESDLSVDQVVVEPAPEPPRPPADPAPEPAPEPVDPEPPPPSRTPVRPAPVPTPATADVPRVVALFVNSRPWSHVSIDGKRVGRTSDTGARFELPSGEHVVRLESSSGLSWQRVVDVGAATRLCVNLRTGTEFGC